MVQVEYSPKLQEWGGGDVYCRMKVWVQEEEAMDDQRRNGVVNEEGGMEHLNL